MKKIFYKGQEVDINDIRIQWTDCFGNICNGNIHNFESSVYNEAFAECEAGEGW